MFKKIFLSSILGCYLFAGIAEDVENCKVSNKKLDDILECVREKLSDNTKYPNIISVYDSTQDLPHNESHKDFYDEIDIKFQEAMLEIRASAVAEQGLDILAKSSKKVVDNSKNKEAIEASLKEEALEQEEAIKANRRYESLIDGLFRRIQQLIDPDVNPKDWTSEQKERAKIEARKALYSSNFTQEITKGNRFPKTIQAVVPLTTIIHTNEQGKSELGVVAYISKRSIALYDALKNNNQVPVPEDKSQCISANDMLKSMNEESKLTTLGLQYFYNENCQPSLLSYGFSVYDKDPDLEREYKNTAKSEAVTQAEANITEFLGASTTTQEKVTKQSSAVQEALFVAMEDAIDKGELIVKNAEKKIAKSVSKEMKSIAGGNTKGMKVVKRWAVDKDDYGVAGAIVYYSVDSIASIDNLKNQINNANVTKVKKPAAPVKPSTRGSSNIVVDDF